MFTGKARQLTIFIAETDQYHHQALYMAIIEMLRREGCGGATAVRGIAGFGASSLIHSAAILRLSMDLPIVISLVDRPERIDRIIAPLREMAPHALITAQEMEVVQAGAPFREGLPDVRVADVMRREVISVHRDGPLSQVIELLLEKGFTALPVVDEQRLVVGIVTDSDLLTRGGMNVTISLQRAADPDFVRELRDSLDNPNRKVSDVMTAAVVTIAPEASLGRAARVMVDKKLKRLPVVDKVGKLVGILGRLDILNTLAMVHLPEWHPAAHLIGRQATVGEVMTREVPTVHESATVEEIFELLVSSAHKRVVVVDEKSRVVGIVADSDLISRVSRENWPGVMQIFISKMPIGKLSSDVRKHLQRLRARSAKEFMTPDVITVMDKMPVASALALSAEKRVKRLPVVNADRELVGIVGRTEMMRALLS
jgi:CBS-domain-containing membrane protein